MFFVLFFLPSNQQTKYAECTAGEAAIKLIEK